MKGLSIEEKAKAYDKALTESKKFLALCKKCGAKDTVDFLENTFPELKESENEKIKKDIIKNLERYIECVIDGYDAPSAKNFAVKEIEKQIAWLENLNLIMAKSPQLGEQKPFDYEDANIQQKDFAPKSAMEATKEEKIDNANKVEPKFHEGDWIIRSAKNFKHNTYIIKEIKDYYVCEDLKGRRVTFTFSDVHKNFKSWGISDAKDGDVLVTKKGNLFIYDKNRYDNGLAYYYVGLVNKELTIKGPHNMLGHFGELHSVFPATKDQRDTLEKAMADAGYIFDFEKKELKKIENTRPMLSDFFNAEYERGKADALNMEWSEEDKMMIEETLYFLREYQQSNRCKDENGMQNSVTCEEWLKSLKQRIGG